MRTNFFTLAVLAVVLGTASAIDLNKGEEKEFEVSDYVGTPGYAKMVAANLSRPRSTTATEPAKPAPDGGATVRTDGKGKTPVDPANLKPGDAGYAKATARKLSGK